MRARRLGILLACGAVAALAVTARTVRVAAQVRPVSPVENFDIDKYMGRWFELARYPNRFQKRCTGDVVVYYARRADGRVDVKNTCATAKGPIEAKGVARRADPKGPASVLEVRFAPAFLSFLPVWGDYWVLDLAPDYSTAVVGSPDRDYLWVLSRTPDVDQPTYARLVEAVRDQGFDPARLVRTRQGAR
ncbi:membrane protein [Luteitalea sp. TBR-22]|uniref:lipocalin family protein n=1 Tax=Luteitalea sp. TBR-22 TaxID=2802971 RepID=UPI001AF087CE|nr:lipocalin family protein [Luteitalea sp. TBR-22]BCS31342.1 membrane protein [Luteitalea sp. TBR-22]